MSIWDDLEDAAGDVVDAAGAVIGAAGDVVEGVFGTVADVVEDVVNAVGNAIQDAMTFVADWANKELGEVIGAVVSFVGGIINGLVEGVKAIVHAVAAALRDIGAYWGALLRFDVAGVIKAIGNFGADIIGLVINIGRAFLGGYIVGGVIKQFERRSLRPFVEGLLSDRFGSQPAVLDGIRDKVGLNDVSWGLELNAQHRVFMLDSAYVQLWRWHEDGVIDLYALAGLLSFDSFQVQRPETWVRTVDSDGQDSWFPVNRWAISRYLRSRGAEYRLRVYAATLSGAAEKLDVATTKVARLGINLSWDWGSKFARFGRMFPTHEIKERDEYRFVLANQDTYVREKALRPGGKGEECVILALNAFHYRLEADHEGFGQVGGRQIAEGPEAAQCATVGRTDACCITVRTDDRIGSSVIHRDVWPRYTFRYILAHEIGHYLGLCHYGHDGVQNIMFQLAANTVWDVGLLKYYYQDEPEFTLDDAKNAWRFIVDQMACCLSDRLSCSPNR